MTNTVEIKAETARTCLNELELLIKGTGGEEAENPCTALAYAIALLEDMNLSAETRKAVDDVFEQVAKERGAETATVDPLDDDVFQARNELERMLSRHVHAPTLDADEQLVIEFTNGMGDRRRDVYTPRPNRGDYWRIEEHRRDSRFHEVGREPVSKPLVKSGEMEHPKTTTAFQWEGEQ